MNETKTKSTEKLNVKLLRKIQAHITEEPRRFFMQWFEAHGEPGSTEWKQCAWADDISDKVPPCGSAACIAGWANALTGARKGKWDSVRRASRKLGMSAKNDCLFSTNFWPNPFRSRYGKSRTPKTRAKIACERIDHLIKTGK